jgi:lipopolysaccharide export system protein LptC
MNSLNINSQKKEATTEDLVSIINSESKTTARGLEIDVESGQARLLTNVETVYAPQP